MTYDADGLTSDELGELAEDHFKTLTTLGRMVANKVGRDRAGWDYMVELEPPHARDLPNDARPGLLSLSVQVKGQWRGRGPRVRLTRSAAEKLAKRSGPSEITFLLTAKDRLPTATGAALRARLLAAVPKGEAAYVAMKAEQQETLGFEEGRYTAILTLKGAGLVEIVDAMVGRGVVAGELSAVRQRRFGIDLPSDAIPTGPGLVEMFPEPRSACRLTARSAGIKLPLVFAGGFYHAALPGPKGLVWRSRFDFDLFEINHTQTGFRFEATVEPTSSDARSLRDWVAFYRLMVASDGDGADCELRVDGSDSILRWRFSRRGRDEDLHLRVELFETAFRIADALGLADAPVPARDVYAVQKRIYAAAGFCLDGARHVRIVFPTNNAPQDVGPADRIYVGLFYLGPHRIAFAVKVVMELEDPARPQHWMTTEPRAIALDRIGDTPPDFKRFVEEAKTASGIDDVLLDDLDPAFLAEAIGDCAVF